MKRMIFAVLAAFTILALSGCGSDRDDPPIFVASILSDADFDGDIQRAPVGTYVVTQGNTQSVFAGIDPVSGVEYRAFLDFPLSGAGGVPADAIIDSAFLDLFINSIDPQPLIGTIPVRIDLVAFQPPFLVGPDFDRTDQPALATMTLSPPISAADFGRHVRINVTSLMIEAQRTGQPDFQVRILEDLGVVPPGLIEINDTTGVSRGTLAPLLEVNYF